MVSPLATVTRSAGRTTHVASHPSDRMNVGALRDFVAALDHAGIPDDVRVECSHNPDTRHLTGLSVRFDETLPFFGKPAPADTAGAA